jgi:hypothetical protein
LTCGADLNVDTTGHHYITSALATTLTATTENLNLVTSSATGDISLTSGRSLVVTTNTTGGISRFDSNKDQDIMRINNTVYDSKFLIGSETTGFRQTVNNNSYAKLQALNNSELELSTENGNMSLTATGESSSLTLTSGLDVNVVTGDDFTVTTTGGITMVSGARINMTADQYVDVIDTDLHIQQLNYNPFDSQYQIGYTVATDLDCGTVSATVAEETNFTLPSKGVWLIIMGFEWVSVSNTILTKAISISETTASLVSLANGLAYFEGIDDVTTVNQTRQKLTMSGVYIATAAQTVYVNAEATVNTGTRPSLKIKYSYTRLG